MFEQILETGSSRPLKGRSLGGGVANIYIYIHICMWVFPAQKACLDRAMFRACFRIRFVLLSS